MSLSDKTNDEFTPLAIQALDNFDDEIHSAGDETDPDFDRFKLLIDQSVFEKEDDSVFEAFYNPQKAEVEESFDPLIKSGGDADGTITLGKGKDDVLV